MHPRHSSLLLRSYSCWIAIILVQVCYLFSAVSVADEFIEADHVRIHWLAPQQFSNQSANTRIGIYFEVDPEWHVYWRNAGDSGAAPRFDFKGAGVQVSDPHWPYPKRLPIAHLTNLGYEGNVAYLFDVQLDTDIGEQLQLTAELEWLVCKEECIPGFGTLTLDRPVGGAQDQWQADDANRVAEFTARLPGKPEAAPWQIDRATFAGDTTQLTLHVASSVHSDTGPEVYPPDAYPMDGNFVSAAAPEVMQTKDGFTLRFSTVSGVKTPDTTGFVVVANNEAWEFSSVPIETDVVAPVIHATSSLALLLFFAFMGGVILNLMPCVFPVLSIKLFSLIKTTGQGASAYRLREGLLYTAGVLVTFAALGGIFLAVRAGGSAIGWGFQLQSPWVVLGLALLFWLMALSFIGAFEFGHRLMNLAGKVNGGSSFGTGILAVFVAAPCTGPFMGAALGASATLPAVQAMAIFIGLGAGLAAPFLILAISPRLSSLLPKPGPWMESLRQFLAFPLFATVLWLLWVLSHLVGGDAWVVGAGLLLVVSLAVWMLNSDRAGVKVGAWALVLLTSLLAIQQLEQTMETSPVAATSNSAWGAYNAQEIADARTNGQAVFIDYTAAWCITCQVNKKLVLDTDAASELFEQHDVLRIRADWTRYDENITQALAALNRNSVPVYVYYPANNGDTKVLPQLLTIDMIRDLFP